MAGQQDIGALVVTLEAQTAAFEKGMAQATKSLQGFGGASKAVEAQFAGIQGSFFKFNQATLALSTGVNLVATAFGKLRSFATVREQLDNVQASFTAVLGSAERAADMMERVKRISNELGTSLPQTADAVRRMAIGLKQMGSSNAEIEKITATFLKIGAIGGSIEEATAAIFQFSQALGSGTLRGDELISLLERQPLIAQEIAEYLKKIGLSADGSVGSLRKLASEGKVTSQILKDALLDAEVRVAKSYENLPLKISQSLNKLKNRLDQFYIEINKEFKINETIGAGLTQLLSAVEPALANISLFIKDVAKNFEVLQAIALGLGIAFASVLVPALWSVVAASAAFIATPFGLALTAISAAIIVVVKYWKELRTAVLDAAITIVEYAAIAKEAFGFDASNLRAMIIDLEAAKMQTAELGKETAKTEEKTKGLSAAQKAAADAAKKYAEAFKKSMESFRESLFGARIELATIPPKIKELEALISKEQNPVMLEKLKDMLKKLKEELDPADAALRKFAETTQNATNPANDVAKELDTLNKALDAGYISWDTYGIAVETAMAKLGDNGKIQETKDLLDEMGVAIGTTLSNSVGELADVFLEADSSFSKFAESFLKQIAKMIIQIMILKTIQATLGGTSLGNFLGLKANASGDSYDDGTGLKHGVYDKPTFFAFANGGAFGGRSRLGVMGEAGPEAILPLKRGANGQLGVQAGSMAAPETTINVINNNAGQNDVSVSESENADGSKQIDIMITQKVKELFNTGAMDKTMSSNFGARRLGY